MSGQRRVAPRRQGLLDERDARLGAGLEVEGEFGVRPGFVGVDDERRLRRGGADGGDPRRVACPREFDFQHGPPVRPLRGRRHLLRARHRNGEGGGRPGGLR